MKKKPKIGQQKPWMRCNLCGTKIIDYPENKMSHAVLFHRELWSEEELEILERGVQWQKAQTQ